MNNKYILFFTAFVQVFFVSINVYFLSRNIYLGSFISSFLINIIWSFNIKKIAFSSIHERIIYALGASLGCISGLYISDIIKITLL